MSALQRITTEYCEVEDRIRLIGEDENGDALTLLLTQRLLIRLLVHLLEAVATQSTENARNPSQDEEATNLLQGFAQQAAADNLSPQTPVVADSTLNSWLVKEVDIGNAADASISLVFKSASGDRAVLHMENQHLRQWLAIVHSLWLVTEWPAAIWPKWIEESEADDSTESAQAFH